jgi:translocator protein
MTSAVIYSIAACAVSIALEALFAGSGIKARFAELRLPRYAPPLWLWVIIGVFYYAMCLAVIYRLLSLTDAGPLRLWALALLGTIMLINALWNYFFFRTRNLFHACMISLPYTLIALALFPLLLRLDRVAAFCLLPYLFYLIYASALSYRLWKLNPPAVSSENPQRVSDTNPG